MSLERRFFIDLPQSKSEAIGTCVFLSRVDSHHIADVLRLTSGAQITLIDKASGRRFAAALVEIGDSTSAKLTSELKSETHCSPVKTLIAALPKGDALDFILEKCTELGVQNFIIWQSARSVAKVAPAEISKKIARYKKIIEGAAKQCNRSSVPDIIFSQSIQHLLNDQRHLINCPDTQSLVCSFGPSAKSIKEVGGSKFYNVVVGPEGGLSPDEEQQFIATGFMPISLGPTVLRAETACMAAVAMINAVVGPVEL